MRERLKISIIGSKNLFQAFIILSLLDLHYQFNKQQYVHALQFYDDLEMDLSEYWDPKDSYDDEQQNVGLASINMKENNTLLSQNLTQINNSSENVQIGEDSLQKQVDSKQKLHFSSIFNNSNGLLSILSNDNVQKEKNEESQVYKSDFDKRAEFAINHLQKIKQEDNIETLSIQNPLDKDFEQKSHSFAQEFLNKNKAVIQQKAEEAKKLREIEEQKKYLKAQQNLTTNPFDVLQKVFGKPQDNQIFNTNSYQLNAQKQEQKNSKGLNFHNLLSSTQNILKDLETTSNQDTFLKDLKILNTLNQEKYKLKQEQAQNPVKEIKQSPVPVNPVDIHNHTQQAIAALDSLQSALQALSPNFESKATIQPKVQSIIPLQSAQKIQVSQIKDQIEQIKQRQQEEAMKMLTGNQIGLKDLAPIIQNSNQLQNIQKPQTTNLSNQQLLSKIQEIQQYFLKQQKSSLKNNQSQTGALAVSNKTNNLEIEIVIQPTKKSTQNSTQKSVQQSLSQNKKQDKLNKTKKSKNHHQHHNGQKKIIKNVEAKKDKKQNQKSSHQSHSSKNKQNSEKKIKKLYENDKKSHSHQNKKIQEQKKKVQQLKQKSLKTKEGKIHKKAKEIEIKHKKIQNPGKKQQKLKKVRDQSKTKKTQKERKQLLINKSKANADLKHSNKHDHIHQSQNKISHQNSKNKVQQKHHHSIKNSQMVHIQEKKQRKYRSKTHKKRTDKHIKHHKK